MILSSDSREIRYRSLGWQRGHPPHSVNACAGFLDGRHHYDIIEGMHTAGRHTQVCFLALPHTTQSNQRSRSANLTQQVASRWPRAGRQRRPTPSPPAHGQHHARAITVSTASIQATLSTKGFPCPLSTVQELMPLVSRKTEATLYSQGHCSEKPRR